MARLTVKFLTAKHCHCPLA